MIPEREPVQGRAVRVYPYVTDGRSLPYLRVTLRVIGLEESEDNETGFPNVRRTYVR